MKRKIKYYDIEHGAPPFSTPKFTREEIVKVKNQEALDKYILKQKDKHGYKYRISEVEFMGYQYVSNLGAVKVCKVSKTKKI